MAAPLKKTTLEGVLGKFYGEKLYNLLSECCTNSSGGFCYEVLKCLGISPEGNPSLVLNQQGEWITNGTGYTYEIGQYVAAQGGVIAHRWLSTSSLGSPTSGTIQNYLVVDTADLSTSALWASSNVDISNVESTWNGTTNTANLIAAGAGGGITAGTAAELCNSSTNNGKSDWYLPSIDELSKIWQNRWDIAQGITTASGTQLAFTIYWGSTEDASTTAWGLTFISGITSIRPKANSLYVRAVRKFSI
jgi:hypothetical protein